MTKTFDFWADYDNLYKSLILADKKVIADSLKTAQMYATGMTDGWFDFMNAFETAINDNRGSLSIEEKSVAEDLLLKLKKQLTNK